MRSNLWTAAAAILLLGGGLACEEEVEDTVTPAGQAPVEAMRDEPPGAPVDEVVLVVGEEQGQVRIRVAADGDSTCEQAYQTSVAWVRGMQQLWGGEADEPNRAAFLEVCRDLPEKVQRCMLLDYAIANRRECERARDALDPELAARLRAVSPVAEESPVE